MLAVFKRVKPPGNHVAFVEEWKPRERSDCEPTLAAMLLISGIGFICEKCGDALQGLPNYARTDGQSCSAMCIPCAQEAMRIYGRSKKR
jgi:hypothetical protein